jgi:hypothetical protein
MTPIKIPLSIRITIYHKYIGQFKNVPLGKFKRKIASSIERQNNNKV